MVPYEKSMRIEIEHVFGIKLELDMRLMKIRDNIFRFPASIYPTTFGPASKEINQINQSMGCSIH